jgi:hypothetical protein
MYKSKLSHSPRDKKYWLKAFASPKSFAELGREHGVTRAYISLLWQKYRTGKKTGYARRREYLSDQLLKRGAPKSLEKVIAAAKKRGLRCELIRTSTGRHLKLRELLINKKLCVVSVTNSTHYGSPEGRGRKYWRLSLHRVKGFKFRLVQTPDGFYIVPAAQLRKFRGSQAYIPQLESAKVGYGLPSILDWSEYLEAWNLLK